MLGTLEEHLGLPDVILRNQTDLSRLFLETSTVFKC